MVRTLSTLFLGLALAACVDEPSVECGAGTHEDDGTCLPDDDDLTCGAGTHLEGDTCVADEGLMCGAGTHVEGTSCVPDIPPPPGNYQLRIITNQIPADGYSRIPVLAIGTNPDGTPATDMVVLNTSRAGAGSFTPVAPTLGALGVTSYFTACNFTTPGCTGPVTLLLALASAPTVAVASVDVELVMPTGVGSAAPCLTGGNVMFFDGNDFIYNGMLTIGGDAAWTGSSTADHLRISNDGPSSGSWWYLEFDASDLPIELGPGVYDDAERYPFQGPGHPGLSISGSGRGCNTLTGRFQIHEHVRDAAGLVRATATFEQHCEGGPNALRGCVHYARP